MPGVPAVASSIGMPLTRSPVSSDWLPLIRPGSDVWSVQDPPGPLVVEVMAADWVAGSDRGTGGAGPGVQAIPLR